VLEKKQRFFSGTLIITEVFSMDSISRFFLSTYTPDGWNSLGPLLRQERCWQEACLLLSGPGCDGGGLLRRTAGEAAQSLAAEILLSPTAPYLPEAVILPERHTLAAIASPFGGTVPPIPGPSEYYVNLTSCYDRAGLREILPQVELCQAEEAQCAQRAARCLRAMEQLSQDMRATLLTSAVLSRMEKRAAGILARECRALHQPAAPLYRYLSAYTAQGHVALFETVNVLCQRVYEIVDDYGLSHYLLNCLAAGAVSAGHEVIVCLSPLEADRIEHLLIPGLSLAFLSSTPALPWPGKANRRIHLETMLESDLLRHHRGRLRFIRKVIASLQEECDSALTQAAELHQAIDELFTAYVDQDALHQLQDDAIASILAVSE